MGVLKQFGALGTARLVLSVTVFILLFLLAVPFAFLRLLWAIGEQEADTFFEALKGGFVTAKDRKRQEDLNKRAAAALEKLVEQAKQAHKAQEAEAPAN